MIRIGITLLLAGLVSTAWALPPRNPGFFRPVHVPTLPVTNSRFLTVHVDHPDYRDRQYAYFLVRDGQGRPLGLEIQLQNARGKVQQRFQGAKFSDLERGVTLLSANPFEVEGDHWYSVSTSDLVQVQASRASPSRIAVQLRFRPNLLAPRAAWVKKNFRFDWNVPKGQWIFGDEHGREVKSLNVVPSTLGIEVKP